MATLTPLASGSPAELQTWLLARSQLRMPLPVVAWAILSYRKRPHLIGQSEMYHTQTHFGIFVVNSAVRILLVSPVSLPYRGNTTSLDGVWGGLVVVGFVVLFGFVACFLVAGVWLCSCGLPHHHVVSPFLQ